MATDELRETIIVTSRVADKRDTILLLKALDEIERIQKEMEAVVEGIDDE